MVSKQEIERAVALALDGLIPELNDRTWLVEYLYRYKIGNKLPRGKRFDFYREAENKERWFSIVKSYPRIDGISCVDRISPFLISQLVLLDYATIKNECQLKTGVVLDVIKMLEGGRGFAPSTELSKTRIKFSKSGVLKDYEHSHVPMLPNAYGSMLKKNKNRRKIVNFISDISFGLDKVEDEIRRSGHSKPGRMTGHWMVTKVINGKVYYLGVFPHSRGALDDCWIYEQVVESERYLNINT